jgi:general secretion pathway protein G
VFGHQGQRRHAGGPEQGFTLAELLVVVVILGILAAVVVFAVGNATDEAEKSACDAERATLETAIEAYRAQVGSYPSDTDDLLDNPETTDAPSDGFLRHLPTLYMVSDNAGGIARTDKGVEQECAAVN